MTNCLRLMLGTVFLMTLSCNDAQESKVFSEEGKALKGYDPVAFFTEHKPVLGNEAFTYTYNDALWLFASESNLNKFKNNPDKYLPQYGGYCAFGMSKGYKAPVEIETWSIVEGELYFNYNKDVQKKWSKDQENLIDIADENWMQFDNQ
ncbi:YHS domain-containing (seleno)protein [Maribacter litoralis]|uniref:YHS domain-containing (seleno)protein n=1 Tax=Maribacter litoralis TaxID=2059726 RepID=UPI003F5CCF76